MRQRNHSIGRFKSCYAHQIIGIFEWRLAIRAATVVAILKPGGFLCYELPDMSCEGENEVKTDSPDKPVSSPGPRKAIALRSVNAAACGLSAFVLTVLGWKLLCGG